MGSHKAQTFIQVDSTNYMAYPLKYLVSVLPDIHATLDYYEAKSPSRQSQFVPYYDDIEWDTPGITKYWIRATIKNTHDGSVDFWWYSGATRTQFFDEDTSGAIIVHLGGRNTPYEHDMQHLPQNSYPPRRLIPIHLDAHEEITIYLLSDMPDYWKRYQNRTLYGYLVTNEYIHRLQKRVMSENYSFAFLIGIITALTIFLFIYYIIYRDLAFFALALMTLSRLGMFLYQKGFLFTTLLASSSSKAGAYDLGDYILVPISVFIFYFYVSVFLDLKRYAPYWKRIIWWAAIGLTGILFVDAFLRFLILPHAFKIHVLGWQLNNIGIALTGLLFLIIGVHLSIKKVPLAGIFLFGNLFNTLGLILHSLSMNFTSFALFRGTDQWGTAIMLMTFSIALALRMRSMETEVLKIDADLKAANKLDAMKTSFFTSISHEFRTPLTLIMSPLEKLYDETKSTKARDRLQMILRNARRMQNLISQLLDLAKIQSNKIQLEVSEHDFSKHIRTISAAHESLAESKDLRFATRIPEEELPLYYNREMMNRIVNNLLSNAFKYCTAGGDVILSVIQNDDRIELKIENSGETISPEDQIRIFEHFQRIETADGQVEGSGVGLALVKDLIGLHHGEIGVRSEPGENIYFTATFQMSNNHFKPEDLVMGGESLVIESDKPVQIAESSPGEVVETTQDKEQPQILVVDDNADMRQFISEELEDTYAISTAVNGRMGLDAAREAIPDLIITDVMMPEMDGFTFLEQSRQDPLLCHIPIIMLTALSTDEAKFKGLETGADDYLLKPFNTRELCIRIANLIRQRERLRERFTLDQAQNLKEVTVTSMDAKFLSTIMNTIETNMADEEFGVKQLSEQVFMSRSQLFRKLSALTNLSPTDFIRIQRLKRAASLLEQHSGNVTQIAYMVGYQNPANFATNFKKQYGVSPSKYSPGS